MVIFKVKRTDWVDSSSTFDNLNLSTNSSNNVSSGDQVKLGSESAKSGKARLFIKIMLVE